MTERQAQALAFVRNFIAARGFSPSVREVAAGIYSGVASAHGMIEALARRGHLRKERHARRSIELNR